MEKSENEPKIEEKNEQSEEEKEQRKTFLNQKTLKIKVELEEEISKNSILMEKITQEIATVVDEIRNYTDQNEEMEKVKFFN